MVHRKESTKEPEFYGIMGPKGHGKDRFAKMVSSFGVFTTNHFAAKLKSLAGIIFGLTEGQMHDPAQKEVSFSVPIEMDIFLGAMRRETSLSIQPAGMVAHSPREVLQFFGTEYVRRAQDDYWISSLINSVTSRRVLVPDTRFPNEAEAIRKAGGKIIKIIRLDLPASGDSHASETESGLIEPDLLLGTLTNEFSVPMKVAALIAKGKFSAALRYDYRRAQKAISAYVGGTSAEDSAKLLGSNHKDPQCLYNILAYYGIPRRKHTGKREAHHLLDGVRHKKCKCGWRIQPI